MAEQEKASNAALDAGTPSPLEQLSKTLENLEERLSRANPDAARKRRSPLQAEGHRTEGTVEKPKLSDVVSKIALRPGSAHRNWHQEAAAPSHDGVRSGLQSPEAMGGVAQQLEQLRNELRRDIAKPERAKLDRARQSFEALRTTITEGASIDVVDDEVLRLDRDLTEMAQSGIDKDTIETLRSQLDEMRILAVESTRKRQSPPSPPAASAASTTEPQRGGPDAERTSAEEHPDASSAGGLEPVSAETGKTDDEEPELSKVMASDGSKKSSPTVETSTVHGLLKAEIGALREQLEIVAAEKSSQAVEQHFEALGERFASRSTETKVEAMAERMTQLEAVIEKLPETLSIGPLEQRVHAMSAGIEALARYQQEEAEADHFAQLEERLDEISRAIVSAASRPPQIDMAPVERIEARLHSLTTRVDDMAVDGDTTIIEERLVELSERMEALADDPRGRELNERLEIFSERLDALSQAGAQSAVAAGAMEARLQSLADKVDEAGDYRMDGDLVRSLEEQIGRLTTLISESVESDGSGAQLEERFAEIERRLDENRDAIAHSARLAADEAIRQMLESGDFRHSDHVAQLSEDLRSLEALSRESGDQSREFFKIVHTTLTQLVERIQHIENDLSGERTGTVAPVMVSSLDAGSTARSEDKSRGFFSKAFGRTRETPSQPFVAVPHDREPDSSIDTDHSIAASDAQQSDLDDAGEIPVVDEADIFDSPEANRPLAVGSGAPNITSLLARVRAQQAEHATTGDDEGKADFIAAARRAAMAAAAEVDDFRATDIRSDDNGTRFSQTVTRRKKPILMAIGAILLAIMALPVASVLTGEDASREDDGPQRLATNTPTTATISQDPSNASPREESPRTAALEDTPAPITAAPPEPPVEDDSQTGQVADKAASSPAQSPLMATTSMNGPAFEPADVKEDVPSDLPPAEDPVPASASAASSIDSTDVAAAGAAAATGNTVAVPAVPDGIGPIALSEAVQNGDPKAIFEVGLRVMENGGATSGPAKAVTWFTNAAERGYAPAQYSLGTLYEKGNGLPRNTLSARDWYLKAAEQGNVRAMHNLAVLYATGIDGKSDPELAAEWFKRAADYGMTDSQYNLGILYARGAGVEQDLTQSYKWFSIVAASGDKDAAAKRDEVARSLTPEQLEDLRQKVASFEPLERSEQVNTVDIPSQWTTQQPRTSEQQTVDSIATSAVDVKKAVRNIQAILIKLGYNPGTPDGIPGAQTTAAIRSFQKEAGLDVTGKIDETLIMALLARKNS